MERSKSDRVFDVLFLCTGNTAAHKHMNKQTWVPACAVTNGESIRSNRKAN